MGRREIQALSRPLEDSISHARRDRKATCQVLSVLIPCKAPYLNPATKIEDLALGDLLIALVVMDVSLRNANNPQVWISLETAVQGVYLSILKQDKVRDRLFKLFGLGLSQLPERLGALSEESIANKHDRTVSEVKEGIQGKGYHLPHALVALKPLVGPAYKRTH